MSRIDDAALSQLFFDARTASAFLDEPISLSLLQTVYDTARMGPTSMNCQPARYVFLKSKEAKERLRPALMAGNVDKTLAAPVTVIIATDTRFHEWMPKIWHGAGAMEMFAGNAALREATATRNSTLSGAYFIMAARAHGLDCGPMSGFDAKQVNEAFFPDGRYQVNFLLNLGYADQSQAFPRNPRLSFDEACSVL